MVKPPRSPVCMSVRRTEVRFKVGSAVLAALVVGGLSMLALTRPASADPPVKDTVCHVAGQSGNTIQITVSGNAATNNPGNGGHLQNKHQDGDDQFVARGQVGGPGAEVMRDSSSCVSENVNPPPCTVNCNPC